MSFMDDPLQEISTDSITIPIHNKAIKTYDSELEEIL